MIGWRSACAGSSPTTELTGGAQFASRRRAVSVVRELCLWSRVSVVLCPCRDYHALATEASCVHPPIAALAVFSTGM